MSNIKYAQYFDEGAGYLFVADLGEGFQGDTMLVRCIADDKIYVRKRTFPQQQEAGDPSEVRFYRPWPLIPILIDWKEYEGTGTRWHTTIWEFCNGGDLGGFIDKYDQHPATCLKGLEDWIPEGIIWRFCDQMLRTLAFMQHNLPPVVHRDLNMGNFFLNWPVGAELPDFFLGDFGRATSVDMARQGSDDGPSRRQPKILSKEPKSLAGRLKNLIFPKTSQGSSDSPSRPSRRQPKIFSKDLESLAERLKNLMFHKRDLGDSRVTGSFPYSMELRECIAELYDAARDSEDMGGTVPDLTDLIGKVRAAALASADGVSDNALLTKPLLTTSPKLYDTKEDMFRRKKPAGTWHIAAVEATTFQIVRIEDEVRNPIVRFYEPETEDE